MDLLIRKKFVISSFSITSSSITSFLSLSLPLLLLLPRYNKPNISPFHPAIIVIIRPIVERAILILLGLVRETLLGLI